MKRFALPMSLLFGAVSVIGLVLPWLSTGERQRSSIDLIGSAGALDVIEGFTKAVVIAMWFLLPMLAAGSFLAFAAGRSRLAASLVLPLGPVLGLIVGLLFFAVSDQVAWGAWVSAACGICGSLLALVSLVSSSRTQ